MIKELDYGEKKTYFALSHCILQITYKQTLVI